MFHTKPRRLRVLAFWPLLLTALLINATACGEPQQPDRSGRGKWAGLKSLRTAVESLQASFPSQYPGEAFLQRLADLRRRLGDGEPSSELRDELRSGVKITSALVSRWWEPLCNSNLVAIRRKQSDRLPGNGRRLVVLARRTY